MSPLSPFRALLLPDGTLCVPGFASIKLEGARSVSAEPLPFPGWQWGHRGVRFSASAFVTERGAFERIEVKNRSGEPRKFSLFFDVECSTPSRLRLKNSSILAGTVRVASFSGGKLRLEGRRLVTDLVLPPKGMRTLELVLAPTGDITADSLETERGRLRAACDELRSKLAQVQLPDEMSQRAFERAWTALSFAIAAGGHEVPWVWKGAPAAAGPAALDATALRALDLWGGRSFTERCLAEVFAHQKPSGRLYVPPEGPVSRRAVSDSGALLWAASARLDVRPSSAYLRSSRKHIESACAWLLSRPQKARKEPWWWKGLDAAARLLERLGSPVADTVRSSLRIPPRMREDASRRLLGLPWRLPAWSSAEPEFLAAHAAAALCTTGLDPAEEIGCSAIFLLALKYMLLAEESGVIRIFPQIPQHWLDAGKGISFERLPSSSGPIWASLFVAGGGDRFIWWVRLPRRAGPAELVLPSEVRRRGWRIKLNGARVKPARAIRLPPGGGEFRAEAFRDR